VEAFFAAYSTSDVA